MQNLILHVGHQKTGSSYLQSIFELNRDFLHSNNICYPISKSSKTARQGYISSGNGIEVFNINSLSSNLETILISGETLFEKLISDTDILKNLSKKFKITTVIYTRNIIEFCVSRWSQFVKREGVFYDIDTFLKQYRKNHLDTLLQWISISKKFDINLKIRNYSVCKENLVNDFFEYFLHLEISNENLIYPSNKSVNRSLTFSELEIQRLFNFVYGKKTSKYFSDYIVNNFPDIQPFKVPINPEIYEVITKKFKPKVDIINRYLGNDQKIKLEEKKSVISNYDELKFMENKVLEKCGKKLKETMIMLKPSEIDLIRDISLKLAKEHKDIASAHRLIQIARTHRPNGTYINHLYDKWLKKLK